MNKYILVIFLITSFNSCKPSSEDLPPTIEERVDSYKVWYMHYGILVSDTVQIQYNNQNIIRRTGGFLDIGGALFTDGVYDTVTYNANQVLVVKGFSYPGLSFHPNERRFFYTGNKIEKAVIKKSGNTYFDTTKYFYNGESLSKQVTYSGRLVSQANFYYNANKNLDSIITRYSAYNSVTKEYEIDFSGLNREKEIFENYDSYVNPTRKLVIFEETFNRSLSANNYRKYSKFKYDKFGTITSSSITTWNLKYENGKINFAK